MIATITAASTATDRSPLPMRRTPSLSPAVLLLLCAALAACSGYDRPERAPSQLAFGVDMAQRGLWSEALFRFHQAERLDPENPHVQNNLGVAYEAAGEFDKALEHYQKALRLAPDSRQVKDNYARFVEFYQSFRPKEDKKAQAAAGRQPEAAAPPPAEPPVVEPPPAEPPVVEPPPAAPAPAEPPPGRRP